MAKKYVWINGRMAFDIRIRLMTSREFMRKLRAAMEGGQNEFSRYIRFARPGRIYPPGWSMTKARVFARDNFTCRYCGATDLPLACDHVIPVSRGGSHDDGNLVTACISCNSSKRDKTPDEWFRSSVPCLPRRARNPMRQA